MIKKSNFFAMKMSKNVNKYINLNNLEYESSERSTPAKAIQVQEMHYITEQRDEIEFCPARRKKRHNASFKVHLARRAPDRNAIELPATATLTTVRRHCFAQPTLQLTRYFFFYIA